MFNDVIINMLRLIETRITQMRDRASEVIKEAGNHVNQILEVKPGNKPIRFVAVDSGFAEINYLGFRISVINVATLINSDGVGKLFTMFEPIIGVPSEELERFALNLEVRYALDAIRRFPVDLLLLDGPILNRDGADRVGVQTLAHVKDVRSNRYTQSITEQNFRDYMERALRVMEEPLAIHILMETRRGLGDVDGALITRPYVIGRLGNREVYGFYVQYVQSTLPIYVEYLGDLSNINDIISRLTPLSKTPRLGYPAPLYIVDRVARVNAEFRSMVRLIIEKLGGDVLNELRGEYLRISLNEYVKGIN